MDDDHGGLPQNFAKGFQPLFTWTNDNGGVDALGSEYGDVKGLKDDIVDKINLQDWKKSLEIFAPDNGLMVRGVYQVSH
jgi:hypothetical protein